MWPSKSLQENGNGNHKKQGIKTLAIFSIFILTNQIIIVIVHFLLVTLFLPYDAESDHVEEVLCDI